MKSYANSAAMPMPPVTMKSVMDAMQAFIDLGPAPEMPTILVNPANAYVVQDVRIPIRLVDVVESVHVPERFTKTIWHPPHGDRFVEYGPEDEDWMRPLGLGTVETIDMGPALFLMDQAKLRMQMRLEMAIEARMLNTAFPAFAFPSKCDAPRMSSIASMC